MSAAFCSAPAARWLGATVTAIAITLGLTTMPAQADDIEVQGGVTIQFGNTPTYRDRYPVHPVVVTDGDTIYRYYPNPTLLYPSTPSRITDSTLINPTVVNSTIEDSTLINPVIVNQPRYRPGTRLRIPSYGSSSGRSCTVLASMRAACR
jgi:hypothetical protein